MIRVFVVIFSSYFSDNFLQVAKHLFQGPSTALEQPGAHCGKQGNASLCGLTLMTPHTIAYVAIQVCHNDISDFSLN